MPNNINPTLIHGQVMSWLDKSGADIRPYERDYIETRIYSTTDSGFYFTGRHQSARWYYKDSPDDEHFRRADQDGVESAVKNGAKIQVCGIRGTSYGVWSKWDDFSREVLN